MASAFVAHPTEKTRPITDRAVDKYMMMEQLRSRLQADRAPYVPLWMDIQQILDPHLVIWDMMQAGFPDFVTDLFLTSKHLQSFDDLVSGLQEGITPMSQTWAKFGLMDDEDPLGDDPTIWNFFHQVTMKFQSILLNTNFYQQIPSLYRSVSRFLTGAIMMERDPVSLVRFTVYPIGSYYISNDNRGITDTFCREFRMKVKQVVEEFCTDADGNVNTDNLSDTTRLIYEDPRRHEEWINVIMMIMPNPEFDSLKAKYISKYKKFSLNYYEYGQGIGGKILREEGFDYFPVYCPRWFRQPTDSYGTDGPGAKARAPIWRLFKAIQMYLNGLQKVIEPPMVADPQVAGVTGGGYRGTTPNFLTVVPGGAGPGKAFAPAYQIQPDLKAVQEFMLQTENEIDKLCMADIFRALSNLEGKTPLTATEVLQRVQENSRVLGPIFGAFNFDWLQPMIMDLYWIMVDEKVIPPAPKGLHGKPLKVEVISRIAIALKQGDINAMDAFVQGEEALAQVKQMPGTERLNADEVSDYRLRTLNLPPKFLYSPQQVAKIRQQMNEMKAKQQAMAQAEQASKTAKNLGAANTGGDSNMLQKLIQQAQGGTSAT